MLELLQFRFSPYNEKVRWALDAKRVPHLRRSLLPGPHMAAVRGHTGRTTTPVLLADGVALDGSARIVQWLDTHHPEPRLIPADAAEREQALRIERWFDEDLTPRGRRAVLAALLRTPAYFARVFGDGRGALARAGYALAVPLAAPLIRKGNGIAGRQSIDDGLRAFDEGLDFVAQACADTGYLVGGRFTIADLTAAAVLAVVVDPPDSPMTRPQPMAGPMRGLVQRYAGHPGAAWVRSIYALHRGASADFDGESPYR